MIIQNLVIFAVFNITDLSIIEFREKAEKTFFYGSGFIDLRSHLLTQPKEQLSKSIMELKNKGYEEIYPYVNVVLRMYLFVSYQTVHQSDRLVHKNELKVTFGRE